MQKVILGNIKIVHIFATMKAFKKGDKVWSPLFGFGEVEFLSEDNMYPVNVDFKGSRHTYTTEGKGLRGNFAPTLFHADDIPEYYQQFIVDERIGKVGYFWNEDYVDDKFVIYSILKNVDPKNELLKFQTFYGAGFPNFSLTPPEHIK